MSRKHSEGAANRAEADRRERDRIDTLRQRDLEVDAILEALIRAKLELQHLLSVVAEFDLAPEETALLERWVHSHKRVFDFHVFREVRELLPEPGDEEPVLFKEEIEELLDDQFDAQTCLAYADEQLGIERGYEYWDGLTDGGVNCERADGRYEDVNKRFERALANAARN